MTDDEWLFADNHGVADNGLQIRATPTKGRQGIQLSRTTHLHPSHPSLPKLKSSRLHDRIYAMLYSHPESDAFLSKVLAFAKTRPHQQPMTQASERFRVIRQPHVQHDIEAIAEQFGAGLPVRLQLRSDVLSGNALSEKVTYKRNRATGELEEAHKVVSTPTATERLRAADALDKATGFTERVRTAGHTERKALEALMQRVRASRGNSSS